MEQDLVEGNIGEAGHYDLEFKEGKLSFKVDIGKNSELIEANAAVTVKVPARAVLEALKKAIPGQIDDVVLELAAKALGV